MSLDRSRTSSPPLVCAALAGRSRTDPLSCREAGAGRRRNEGGTRPRKGALPLSLARRCDVLDLWVTDVDQCQDHFCTYGVDGYLEFVRSTTGFIRSNAVAFGGVCSALALLQLVLIVNIWRMRSKFKREQKQTVKQYAGSAEHQSQYDGVARSRCSSTHTANTEAVARARRASQSKRPYQYSSAHPPSGACSSVDAQQCPPVPRPRVHHSLVRAFSCQRSASDLKLTDVSQSSLPPYSRTC